MSDQPDWMTPDPWERHSDATIAGMKRTPEQRKAWRREYKRRWEWARRHGTTMEAVGWLHEPKCTGNHHGNQHCKPIPVYRKGEDAA